MVGICAERRCSFMGGCLSSAGEGIIEAEPSIPRGCHSWRSFNLFSESPCPGIRVPVLRLLIVRLGIDGGRQMNCRPSGRIEQELIGASSAKHVVELSRTLLGDATRTRVGIG